MGAHGGNLLSETSLSDDLIMRGPIVINFCDAASSFSPVSCLCREFYNLIPVTGCWYGHQQDGRGDNVSSDFHCYEIQPALPAHIRYLCPPITPRI
jgi:hypothetical protein